jgi:hypothetical protein
MMIRNIKAVERTAFPQQAKTVKASPTAGTLSVILGQHSANLKRKKLYFCKQ